MLSSADNQVLISTAAFAIQPSFERHRSQFVTVGWWGVASPALENRGLVIIVNLNAAT